MTDDKPRRTNYSTLAFFLIMAMLIVGGYVLRAIAGEQTDDGTVPVTHTPQPTIYISYFDNTHGEVLSQDEMYAESSEIPDVTHTPVPDFAATQRALDDAVSAHKAAVATQMAEAANVATATELAHQSRLNDTEYDGAIAVLSSKVQSLNYEQELHQQVISHTVEMNAVELERRITYLDAMNVINLVWASSWRALVLVLVVGFCWFVGRRVYNAYEDERWKSTERLEAELERIRKAEEYEQVATEKAVKVAKLLVFIHDAIRVNGEDDNQIPPNTKMDGWNAERWSECVQILKENRLVEIFRGGALQGTFYKRGTLGDLRDELGSGEIPSPTSRAEAARVRYVGRMRDNRNADEYEPDEQNAR